MSLDSSLTQFKGHCISRNTGMNKGYVFNMKVPKLASLGVVLRMETVSMLIKIVTWVLSLEIQYCLDNIWKELYIFVSVCCVLHRLNHISVFIDVQVTLPEFLDDINSPLPRSSIRHGAIFLLPLTQRLAQTHDLWTGGRSTSRVVWNCILTIRWTKLVSTELWSSGWSFELPNWNKTEIVYEHFAQVFRASF